jgi:hypothetical protein
MGLFSSLSFRKRSQPDIAAEAVPMASAAGAPDMVAAAAVPAPSAEARAQAEELVRRVGQELPAFLTVAVVEAATGRLLAEQWAGPREGAVEMAAANAEMVRQTCQCLEALQLTDTEQLTDILITLRHQLHLLRVLPQAGWLLYLAIRTEDTNPALVRAAMEVFD